MADLRVWFVGFNVSDVDGIGDEILVGEVVDVDTVNVEDPLGVIADKIHIIANNASRTSTKMRYLRSKRAIWT